MSAAPRVCVAMAFDSAMFHQAKECIATVRRFGGANQLTLHVLNVGLTEPEVAWLNANGVVVLNCAEKVPTFPDAPPYARAQTCRPFCELAPGYDIYLWLDADIRLAGEEAIGVYLSAADGARTDVVIVQEVDFTFGFVSIASTCRIYHRQKRERFLSVYGSEEAELMEGFYSFNSGIFAMHRDSVIWDGYRANLERALATPYGHMKEQDALTLAIVQSGMRNITLSPVFNWPCSIALPVYDNNQKRFVRPNFPPIPISVLHLTNSGQTIQSGGWSISVYDHYRNVGLTR